jgi:hypothetical protein
MDDDLRNLIEHHWVTAEDAEWIPKKDVLDGTEVKEWLDCENLEILGYLSALMADARVRIEPSLSIEEYIAFQKKYLETCLRENPSGEWADSAYSAGWSLVRIFIKLWDDENVPRSYLLDLKRWVGKLYQSGDQDLRTCLVHATFEHLFERRAIKKYFSDWKADPALAGAYAQACLWNGKTPLSLK